MHRFRIRSTRPSTSTRTTSPATLVSGDGRLLGAWRWDLRSGNDSVQNAMRLFALIAAGKGVPVVAEDLDFRREKAWLRKYGKRFGTVLSLFRTRQLLTALERQCRRRGVEVIYVNPSLDHEARAGEPLPGSLPSWNSSCCGARHRTPRPRVCRACADNGLAPRSRRSEASGYARLGKHARAVAARRKAPERSGAAPLPNRGLREGPVGDVPVPARWAWSCRCKSGCRCSGESGLCPYKSLNLQRWIL